MILLMWNSIRKGKKMKVKVIIEEVISQEFEVEVSSYDNAYNEIREKYKNAELVLENPSLTQANVNIYDEEDREGDWVDLHVN